MKRRYSRRDVLSIAAAAVSGVTMGPGRAAAQRESPPMTYRPRQRPPVSGRTLSNPLPEGLQQICQSRGISVIDALPKPAADNDDQD